MAMYDFCAAYRDESASRGARIVVEWSAMLILLYSQAGEK